MEAIHLFGISVWAAIVSSVVYSVLMARRAVRKRRSARRVENRPKSRRLTTARQMLWNDHFMLADRLAHEARPHYIPTPREVLRIQRRAIKPILVVDPERDDRWRQGIER